MDWLMTEADLEDAWELLEAAPVGMRLVMGRRSMERVGIVEVPGEVLHVWGYPVVIDEANPDRVGWL